MGAKREGSDLKIRKKKINTHVLKKKERIAQKGKLTARRTAQRVWRNKRRQLPQNKKEKRNITSKEREKE